MSTLLLLLFASVAFCWYIFKMVIMVYFNFYGLRPIKIIIDIFKHNIENLRNIKVITVILLWIIHLLALIGVTIHIHARFTLKYHKLGAYIELNMVLIYCWSLASMLWIISIYSCDKLEKIKRNLIKFINSEPGKNYSDYN